MPQEQALVKFMFVCLLVLQSARVQLTFVGNLPVLSRICAGS